MLVTAIQEITKKPSYIYYREEFSATVVYSILGKEVIGAIEFIIEATPMGDKHLVLSFINTPDYPFLPIYIEVKENIKKLISTEKLPI